MSDWKSRLRADPTAWLLEEDNSSVRSRALVSLAGKDPDDPEIRRATAEVMRTGPVPRILTEMNPRAGGKTPMPST